MSDDLILVEKINELEVKLKLANESNDALRKQLRQPIRIVKSFQDLWTWWWKSEYRTGVSIIGTLVTIVGMVLGWAFGGWTTDHFYIDYEHGSAKIYQTLDWGKDREVESCYSKNMGECIGIMKAQEAAWKLYEEAQGER